MPITINGTGSITGISAGGLPDLSITTADLADGAVTTAKLGSNEQSGLCKAFVNFNGTGTVAIRASYNVSSITDNGVGDYTVNFTTAMPDANYSFAGSGATPGTSLALIASRTVAPAAASLRIGSFNTANNLEDNTYVTVAIFR